MISLGHYFCLSTLVIPVIRVKTSKAGSHFRRTILVQNPGMPVKLFDSRNLNIEGYMRKTLKIKERLVSHDDYIAQTQNS